MNPFVAAKARIARDDLKNLKLDPKIVARATQAAQRRIAAAIEPEQNGAAQLDHGIAQTFLSIAR